MRHELRHECCGMALSHVRVRKRGREEANASVHRSSLPGPLPSAAAAASAASSASRAFSCGALRCGVFSGSTAKGTYLEQDARSDSKGVHEQAGQMVTWRLSCDSWYVSSCIWLETLLVLKARRVTELRSGEAARFHRAEPDGARAPGHALPTPNAARHPARGPILARPPSCENWELPGLRKFRRKESVT